MNKTELACAFIQSLGRDGIDIAQERYGTKDMTFWIHARGEVRPRMSEIMKDVAAQLENGDLGFEIVGTTAEDNRVAVEGVGNAKLKNGRIYKNKYHWLLEFEGDRISRVKEYNDTSHRKDVWDDVIGKD